MEIASEDEKGYVTWVLFMNTDCIFHYKSFSSMRDIDGIQVSYLSQTITS